MRFRHLFLGVGSVLVLLALFLSDPAAKIITDLPVGAGTIGFILGTASCVVYIALLHLARRGLLDYIDFSELFKKAVETSTGAGLAAVAVSIMTLAIAVTIHAATK